MSIGIELAAAPKALFLDEPTSGLDATSALSVMNLLRALSRCGILVVCVIHQPRAEIFTCIDELLLLSEGRQVYQGKAKLAPSYFRSLGFHFPRHSNPADVIMDVITSRAYNTKSFRGSFGWGMLSLADRWRHYRDDGAPNVFPDNWGPDDESTELRKLVNERGAPWHIQVWFCFLRSLKQQVRDASGSYLELAVGAASGILIGLSVFQLKGLLFQGVFRSPFEILSTASNYTLVPQLGLLCALAIGLAGSASGVRTFGDEKQMYKREAFVGHSPSAYYVGKVLSTLVRIPLAALHFTVFFNLLATPLMGFGRMYFANLLYYYCIYGLASIVSTVVRKEDGPLLSVMLSLITGIFCGYGPSLTLVSSWHLRWFWDICPGTWFAEAYYTDNLNPLKHLYDIEAAAVWTGYRLDRYAFDMGMLLVIGTIYRILAYLGLRFWPSERFQLSFLGR